ncbi:hypothetical protein ILUMI_08763 [Ignelater luminosus]|uniref:Uncharacterized protein n=1 Tax=Ignelater luminosus TaxID=2038154 RepID=A0A8K0D3S2_IGNLU|nr:hypothetical protein ILUMI_08763 [Ignelater luminosus]
MSKKEYTHNFTKTINETPTINKEANATQSNQTKSTSGATFSNVALLVDNIKDLLISILNYSPINKTATHENKSLEENQTKIEQRVLEELSGKGIPVTVIEPDDKKVEPPQDSQAFERGQKLNDAVSPTNKSNNAADIKKVTDVLKQAMISEDQLPKHELRFKDVDKTDQKNENKTEDQHLEFLQKLSKNKTSLLLFLNPEHLSNIVGKYKSENSDMHEINNLEKKLLRLIEDCYTSKNHQEQNETKLNTDAHALNNKTEPLLHVAHRHNSNGLNSETSVNKCAVRQMGEIFNLILLLLQNQKDTANNGDAVKFIMKRKANKYSLDNLSSDDLESIIKQALLSSTFNVKTNKKENVDQVLDNGKIRNKEFRSGIVEQPSEKYPVVTENVQDVTKSQVESRINSEVTTESTVAMVPRVKPFSKTTIVPFVRRIPVKASKPYFNVGKLLAFPSVILDKISKFFANLSNTVSLTLRTFGFTKNLAKNRFGDYSTILGSEGDNSNGTFNLKETLYNIVNKTYHALTKQFEYDKDKANNTTIEGLAKNNETLVDTEEINKRFDIFNDQDNEDEMGEYDQKASYEEDCDSFLPQLRRTLFDIEAEVESVLSDKTEDSTNGDYGIESRLIEDVGFDMQSLVDSPIDVRLFKVKPIQLVTSVIKRLFKIVPSGIFYWGLAIFIGVIFGFSKGVLLLGGVCGIKVIKSFIQIVGDMFGINLNIFNPIGIFKKFFRLLFKPFSSLIS